MRVLGHIGGHGPRRNGHRRSAYLSVLVGCLVLAGCSSADRSPDGGGAASAGRSVVLERVELPAGVPPVAVTSAGGSVLVGGRAAPGSAVRPRLYLGRDGASLRPIDVAPVSPTAFEARWFQLDLTATGEISALAGAPAGAHSNTRWSTWSGSARGVRELPQTFQTFGGWGAGALNAYVRTVGGQAIIGSWESGQAGLDVSVWRRAGATWTRRPTARDSALASRADLLASARHATPRGEGALAAGSVTALRPGTVTVLPAVWLTDRLDTPWRRVDLPAATASAEAHAAGCGPDRCTVVGQAGGRLVAWVVRADGSVAEVGGLPRVEVGDKVQLTAPMVRPDGTHLVVIAAGRAGHLLSLRPSGLVVDRRYDAPGVPVSATTTAPGVTWLVHRAADESTTLHTVPVS